jgi:hypothetical protein
LKLSHRHAKCKNNSAKLGASKNKINGKLGNKETTMNGIFQKITIFTLVFLSLATGASVSVDAQTSNRPRGYERDLRDLTQRIRVNTDNFRASFDAAVRNVRLRGAEADRINRNIDDYETALSNYEERLENRQDSADEVRSILDAATRINDWLKTARLGAGVQRDWAAVRNSLSQLARQYQINWSGSAASGSVYPNRSDSVYPNRYESFLNGTFRLDDSRSDNPRDAAERAVQNLPYEQQNDARATLEQRLDTPEGLAIEIRGRQITLASTRAPRYTFDADGSDKYEAGDNGANLKVRATLYGERLEVFTSGGGGNDYTVTFEPADNGRGLRVTRRLTTDLVRQPVVVTSYYTKIEPTARLDIYENPNGIGGGYGGGGNRNGDFVIPNDTTLRAILNESVSTKTSNNGDRFSMTVQTPEQFRGAVIEGRLSNIQRSGKVSGRAAMNFNFETIRLRDGRTYSFAGFVQSIRNQNGDKIEINNEGTAQGGNQGKQTVTRGAIGAGLGALIGAIAGGGKGAAIGAIIGGGAGAGSVYIQGRDDLEINSGSDVYIRASAPNRIK